MFTSIRFMTRSALIPIITVASVVSIGAVAGGALAASNTVPASNAGQGVSTVSGFTVSAVEYETAMTGNSTTDPNITTIRFKIVRNVNTGTKVSDANADVFVQVGNALKNWIKCVVTADADPATTGSAVCTMGTDAQALKYSEILALNVVAYDDVD